MTRTTVTVECRSGKVAGLVDSTSGGLQFLGIPFAAPTGGSSRFRKTVPAAPWAGTLQATQFGPAAAHLYDAAEGTPEEFGEASGKSPPLYVGDESALTLNIWTPGADGRRRPVVVFVHGGANWVGASRLPLYQGDTFTANGDVVFVSFNYRLGILGFMEFGAFGGPGFEGSHANGLRDQLEAVRWVVANIDAFGGDPQNITLTGESAGSIDITWLIAGGHLDGLVKRCFLMSGVGGNLLRHDYRIEAGQDAARQFLRHAGIEHMDDVLRFSTEELLTRHRDAFAKLHVFQQSFTPRIDGSFVKRAPIQHAAEGRASKLEVVVGFTSYEMGLYLLYDPELDRKAYAQQMASLRTSESVKQLLTELYDAAYPHEPQGVRGMHMLSDIWFVMPSLLFAEQLARTGRNVWVYEFAWNNPGSRLRAGHALDLCFWFDKTTIKQSRFLLGEPTGAADQRGRDALARHMQDALLQFSRTGSPDAAATGALKWPAYNTVDRPVYVFDRQCVVVKDPRRVTRQWWLEHQSLIWDQTHAVLSD